MMTTQHGHQPSGGSVALSLGALGVVFGDIGTSPLYALKETFHGDALAENSVNVLGVASTSFWALIVVISLKYLAFVMRADHHGEGGILALTSLILDRGRPREGGSRWILVILGLFGTALLYGDGIITPAISVLSAVELLGNTAPSIAENNLIIPISLAILVSLFVVQRKGTEAIGRFFGPIMLVWFTVLGLLGVINIADEPDVLKAVNPIYMVDFFRYSGFKAFLALGSIFLVVTGGEALYADMGHFGRKAIRNAWLFVALPGLVLCYFGQAAVLTTKPESFVNPLFFMAPSWSTWPLSILAIFATIIASQALISGVFSLTLQAVRLDYLPVRIVEQTGGRLRHCRDVDHDRDHDLDVVDHQEQLGLANLEVGHGDFALGGDRRRVLGRQHPQDSSGWLVPVGGRHCPVHTDGDVAQGPRAGGQSHSSGRSDAR
jgi:KUP system potassium uptake protein